MLSARLPTRVGAAGLRPPLWAPSGRHRSCGPDGDGQRSTAAAHHAGSTCPSAKPRIIGRVTDKSGLPVADLEITFKFRYGFTAHGAAGLAQAFGSAMTDADGNYVVPDLDTGVYWVEPGPDPGGPDYWNPPARYVEVRQSDVGDRSFQLATATTRYDLSIEVISDATGYGVPGENVRLERDGVNTWHQQTDYANGEAVFANLWPGVYHGYPPDASTYSYQPGRVDFILTDEGFSRQFRVMPK